MLGLLGTERGGFLYLSPTKNFPCKKQEISPSYFSSPLARLSAPPPKTPKPTRPLKVPLPPPVPPRRRELALVAARKSPDRVGSSPSWFSVFAAGRFSAPFLSLFDTPSPLPLGLNWTRSWRNWQTH